MNMRQTALIGVVSVLFAVPAFGQARDHFLCYKAKSTKKICAPGQTNAGALCDDDIDCVPGGEDTCIKAPKPPRDKKYGVLKDDERPNSVGEDKTFQIKKVKHLCLPIDKNGEGITDPDASYVTYQIKQSKKVCNGGANDGFPCKDPVDDCAGSPCDEIAKLDKKHPDNTAIAIGDQLTNLRVDAGKVAYLMAPASVCVGDDSTPCPDPAPLPGAVDFLKCYAIKASKKFCSNPSNPNYLEACRKDEDCGLGFSEDDCAKLPKFPKGVGVNMADGGNLITSAIGRAYDTKKPAFMCKPTQASPPDGTPDPVINPLNRLLCYKGKAGKQCIAATEREGLNCKKDVDCGGSCEIAATTCFSDDDCPGEKEDCIAPDDQCLKQGKFNKKSPTVQGFYVNDAFDGADDEPDVAQHYRINLNKEDIFCIPACEFSPFTLRATALAIPTTGDPGDGLNIDGLPTCQPTSTSCSGGIDNSLGGLVATLGGFGLDLNDALQGAIDSGDISVLLNIDDFSNGSHLVSGHTGDPYPGCTDPSDPNEVCYYEASCGGDNEIVLPVEITGLPGSPAGVDSNAAGTFSLSIPFSGVDLTLTVEDVAVDAEITHTGGVPETGTGIIGGTIIQRDLKNTIESIPGGICAGGGESGEQCPPATCPSSFCLDFSTIAGLIDATTRDIDTDSALTCEGGTNNGEACTVAGCCDTDPNNPGCCSDCSNPSVTECDAYDGVSIGLVFSGIDAQIGPNAAP